MHIFVLEKMDQQNIDQHFRNQHLYSTEFKEIISITTLGWGEKKKRLCKIINNILQFLRFRAVQEKYLCVLPYKKEKRLSGHPRTTQCKYLNWAGSNCNSINKYKPMGYIQSVALYS